MLPRKGLLNRMELELVLSSLPFPVHLSPPPPPPPPLPSSNNPITSALMGKHVQHTLCVVAQYRTQLHTFSALPPPPPPTVVQLQTAARQEEGRTIKRILNCSHMLLFFCSFAESPTLCACLHWREFGIRNQSCHFSAFRKHDK